MQQVLLCLCVILFSTYQLNGVFTISHGYRITFESIELDNPTKPIRQETLLEGVITQPSNCLDFSLNHGQQIQLLQNALDNILRAKCDLINKNLNACPDCKGKMKKTGKRKSTFNDVFTDHEVNIQRARCTVCKYESPSTIRTFLNGNTMSGALAKIQSELGY